MATGRSPWPARGARSTTRGPSAADQACCAAAAAGRRVDDEILAAVLEAPHAEVADALREAMSRRILVDADGIGGYAFRHALLREVAYDELLFGERDRLHSAFAQQLALRGQVGGVPVTAAELAHHRDAARNVDRAVPAWIDAGLAAERIYAFADAAAHSSARWSLAGGRRHRLERGAPQGRGLCPPHR